MASVTMTAAMLPATTSSLAKTPSASMRRGLVVARASSEKASIEMKNVEENNGRRELVFAATAAAACFLARVAMADEEEPKRGSADAKKKYAPICVTMPTARICRN